MRKANNHFASPDQASYEKFSGRKRRMKSGWWNCSKRFRSAQFTIIRTPIFCGIATSNSCIQMTLPSGWRWKSVIMSSASGLQSIDPFELQGLEPLREELISVIDDHLSRTPIVPRVIFGKPFNFNQSRILEVPTGLEVWTLQEFRNALI